MLIKREWSEINQGDSLYLPELKLRCALAQQGYVTNPNTMDLLPIFHKWTVMRFEDVIPRFVSIRGVQTGEVLWAKIDN